jgi:hypothetical protein
MEWERLLRPEIFGMLIPITAILVVGAIAITKMVIRHRERLAMIERGLDPDHRPEGPERSDR